MNPLRAQAQKCRSGMNRRDENRRRAILKPQQRRSFDMKRNFFKTTLFVAAVLTGSTAFAAEPMTPPTPGTSGASDMSTHHKMMQSEGSMGGGNMGSAGMGAMMGGGAKMEGGMKGMMCGGGAGGSGGGMCGGGAMGKTGPGQGMMSKMGASSGGPGMPKLPPGNEKLEFQMHAEMMQKMGEIALKYADRIKDN